MNHEKYLPKYTKGDAGQSSNPSWTKEGRDRFAALKALNDVARANEDCCKLESEFLKLLRAKLGLRASSHEEQRRKSRRKSSDEPEEYEAEEDAFDEI